MFTEADLNEVYIPKSIELTISQVVAEGNWCVECGGFTSDSHQLYCKQCAKNYITKLLTKGV